MKEICPTALRLAKAAFQYTYRWHTEKYLFEMSGSEDE
jgi:hypothetical protein